MLLSVGLLAQSPTVIWDDDFNSYPMSNSNYICDFVSLGHITSAQMNGFYGSSHGSVSYLGTFPLFSSPITLSFDDGNGIVMNECGADRGEGLFLNVPNGIEANTCYRVSFDLKFAVPSGLLASETDRVFRVALGNGFQDTNITDLEFDCCSDAPEAPQITNVENVVLAELETFPNTGNGNWGVSATHRIEVFVNQDSDFDQLLFFPNDLSPTANGGTKPFLVMFDNLLIESYCPELLLFENQLFIPSGEHRAENIISRTTNAAPPASDNNINPFLSTSFIASKEVLLSPRTTVSLNQPSNQFLATIEPCLLDNECFGISSDFRQDYEQREEKEVVFNSKEVRVFPNPTKDRLFVEMVNVDGIKDVQIIDAQGVYHSNIRAINNGNQIEMEVDKLSPGIYFLRLTHEDQVITKSFVISR